MLIDQGLGKAALRKWLAANKALPALLWRGKILEVTLLGGEVVRVSKRQIFMLERVASNPRPINVYKEGGLAYDSARALVAKEILSLLPGRDRLFRLTDKGRAVWAAIGDRDRAPCVAVRSRSRK